MERYFLSCDWGTSNFRLRLIERKKRSVVATSESEEGVSSVFTEWQRSGGNREEAFLAVVKKHIELLTQASERTPIIISGMACSAIGMRELPYKECPLAIDGSDLIYERLETSFLTNDVYLISGARTAVDVMRGEETQVIGGTYGADETSLIILPGTHSKHVTVSNGTLTDIKTYMTGEMFETLTNKTLIAQSVEPNNNSALLQFFEKGVSAALDSNFLNAIFSVRVNSLLKRLAPGENYHYASGIVIGTELSELRQRFERIRLIGSTTNLHLYSIAINIINPGCQVEKIPAEEAIVNGHSKFLDLIHPMQ